MFLKDLYYYYFIFLLLPFHLLFLFENSSKHATEFFLKNLSHLFRLKTFFKKKKSFDIDDDSAGKRFKKNVISFIELEWRFVAYIYIYYSYYYSLPAEKILFLLCFLTLSIF